MNEDFSDAKWKIGWGFTSACNMFCPFCYSKVAREQNREVSLSVANKFIDNNFPYIDSINYGTGECSLSDNWFEFIYRTRQKYPGIRQALTTNGTIINIIEKNAKKRDIFFTAIDEIDISLDFADKKKHNTIRGHDKAYDWAMGTLDACKEGGIIPSIVIVGYQESLVPGKLDQIFELASTYKAFVRLNLLRPTPLSTMQPPTYHTVFTILEWMIKTRKVVSLCDPLFGSVFDKHHAISETTGKTSLRILPDGNITPSTYLITGDWFGLNINNEVSLDRIRMSKPFRYISEMSIPAKCSNCDVVSTCRGGAIDRRVLYYNSLEKRDPYCPLRNKAPFPDSIDVNYYKINNSSVPNVHDGYLPTLIFAP